MDCTNCWKRVGARVTLNCHRAIFFFARLLKADLPLFVKCTLQDALLDAFYSFGFPVCCGRVASLFFKFISMLFTSVYQWCLRPQSHPKRVCRIQLFQSDLTEGNYLKWSEHYQIYIW